MCSGSRHVTIGYRGAIDTVLTHFKLCAYSASTAFAWGTNKLFHASKNIDARNNWFMALSADLFVTSMSCYLFLVSMQSFALNGRSFALVRYAFEWFFARSFSMFSSMCAEKSSARLFASAATKLLLFLLLLQIRMLCWQCNAMHLHISNYNLPSKLWRELKRRVLLVFSYFDIRLAIETCFGIFQLILFFFFNRLVAAEPDFAPTFLMW